MSSLSSRPVVSQSKEYSLRSVQRLFAPWLRRLASLRDADRRVAAFRSYAADAAACGVGHLWLDLAERFGVSVQRRGAKIIRFVAKPRIESVPHFAV